MRRLRLALLAAALLAPLPAWAQFQSGGGFGGGGGGSGGGGSITFSTTCPTSSTTGSTISLTNGASAVAYSTSHTMLASECGSTIEATGSSTTITGLATITSGYQFNVINHNPSGGANVTISPGAGNTFNGASGNIILLPGQSIGVAAGTSSTDWDVFGVNTIQTLDGPGYKATNWYAPAFWSWAASGVLSATTTYCTPGWIRAILPTGGGSMTIGSLGTRITTLGTSTIALALYTNDTTVTPFRPGTLLGNTGAIVNTSTGPVNGAVSIAGITPGLYWWCSQANDTTVKWEARQGNNNDTWGTTVIGSASQNNVLSTTNTGGVSSTGVYGTWPACFQNGGTCAGTAVTWTEITNTAAAVEFQPSSIP